VRATLREELAAVEEYVLAASAAAAVGLAAAAGDR
jgi:hypothetical protein